MASDVTQIDPTTGEPIPAGPTVGPTPGSSSPPATVGPTPTGGTVQGAYTSGSLLGDTIGFIGTIIKDAEALTKDTGNIDIGGMYHALSRYVDKFPVIASAHENGLWQTLVQMGPGTFYTDMLKFGFGVDTDKFDQNAQDGIKTIDMFFGFAWLLPFITVGVALVGKIPLAGRWIEYALEPLAKIPEEIGLNWAMGELTSTTMEAAIGESLVEGIRRQKRGSRIGWPELRLLLRQHAIDEPCFIDLMKNQGFPDEQIELLRKLDETQLTIGDLQSLWQYDAIDRQGFRDQLRKLGYTEGDVNSLTTLYIDKAQSAAGTMLRSTARGLAAAQLITLDQYQVILQSTHVPEREWRDDIAALQLQIEHGHVQTSLATLKNLYLRGTITAAQVKIDLNRLGYTDDAIASTIQAWDAGPTPRPLSQSKILSYFVSHVLTKDQATTKLLAGGTRSADVPFLLEHAFDLPAVRPHQITPALVTQAYLDGALDHDQLEEAYLRAGATQQVADYMVASAVFRKSRQKRPAGATQPLSEAQIGEAWSYGLIDLNTALAEIEQLGYSGDDAMLLLEIKNKGPINTGPAPKPPFADLGAAEAFLQSIGYTVIPPPDPRIMEAEQVLAQYGYYATPPLPAVPIPGLTTGGGNRPESPA